ncbi:uncharacterized protein NPIL_459331 [Nephila pilipes]|uniref:Uncharacterized protein n=1 Tax=Nephila pilipes TaxID=299642 RepID=A0A8X6NGE4_NEPPI|nr:uncharacterized protein NPIL_459331 [Nephila pilipes]
MESLEAYLGIKVVYSEFSAEYKKLQPTEKAFEDTDFEEGYCIPYLNIYRFINLTSKLRGVFNTKSKTSNGKSLNDMLCAEEVIQKDIYAIILHFRKRMCAFTSDIENLYHKQR